MNDEFADLENELRALRPRAASHELTGRIDALIDQLPPRQHRTAWWRRLGFDRPVAAVGWGICSPALTAAVVIVVLRLTNAERPPSSPETYAVNATSAALRNSPASSSGSVAPANSATSAKATNILYQALDEGVVLDGRQEPVRRLRYRSEDLVEWRDPSSGADWQVSYPREDVVLLPIEAE